MLIFNRYLTKQLLAPALLGVGGLSLLFVSSVIFELGSYLIVRRVHPYLVLLLAVYKLPGVLTMALPLGVFFGSLFTLGRLAADKELIILRMAGLTPCRLLLPCLFVSLVVSGLSFAINEFVVTRANSKAELVMRRIIFDSPPPELMQNIFFRDKERYYFIGKILPNSRELQNVLIFEVRNAKITNLLAAKTGEYQDRLWTLRDGSNYEFDGGGHLKRESAYTVMKVQTSEREESLLQVEKTAQDMSREELAGYIKVLSGQGIDTASYQVDYHLKASAPLAAFIFTLLGAPLFVRTRARKRLYAAGLCVLIVFIYYILSSASAAAGRAYILTPVCAAWLPALFFLLAGALVLWRVNNE